MNCIQHKIHDISGIFTNMLVDVLFIVDTKLDENIFNGQFDRFNYNIYRKDRPTCQTVHITLCNLNLNT